MAGDLRRNQTLIPDRMKLPGFKIILGTMLLLPAVRGADNPPPSSPDSPSLAPAATSSPAPTPAYSLAAYAATGSSMVAAFHLRELGWNDAQISAFIEGLRAAFQGKGYPFDDEAQRLQNEIGRRIAAAQAQTKPPTLSPAELAKQSEQRLKDLRQRHHLQQTDSGLCYSVQTGRNGVSGIRPGPDDTVVISYAAVAADGTSKLPQLSANGYRVKMGDLVPGLTEGIQMMTLGSQAMLVLPPALSFGEADWPPGVERGLPLIFFVTLHEVVSAEAPH